MPQPLGVTITTLLMCLSLGTDTILLLVLPKAHDDVFELIVQCLAGVFVWFYWRGQNWARWLVMIQSIICLLSLFGLRKRWSETHVGGGVFVFDALLSVFLLWYINTARIRRWFTHKSLAA